VKLVLCLFIVPSDSVVTTLSNYWLQEVMLKTPLVTTNVPGADEPGPGTAVNENVPVAPLAVAVVAVSLPLPPLGAVDHEPPAVAFAMPAVNVWLAAPAVYVPGPIIPGRVMRTEKKGEVTDWASIEASPLVRPCMALPRQKDVATAFT
jgi:hypothetical protein